MKKLIVLVLALTLLLCGCEGIDVSALEELDAPTDAPELARTEDYRRPREIGYAEGCYMVLTASDGQTHMVQDDEVCGLILEALEDEPIQPQGCTFSKEATIYTASDTVAAKIHIATDGCNIVKTTDEKSYYIPMYALYMLENALLAQQTSLYPPLTWQGEEDGVTAIKMELEHLVLPPLVSSRGYSDGYFMSYEVAKYKFEKDTVYFYIIASLAGYSYQEDRFVRDYLLVTPVRMVFNRCDKNTWRYNVIEMPEDPADRRSIRSVVPYEYMEDILYMLEDTNDLVTDVSGKARSFLLRQGPGDVKIAD